MAGVILAALGLALPLALGALTGMSRLVRDPHAAVDALNVYALYVAFPAVVIVGLSDGAFVFPRSAVFFLIVPISLAVSLLGVWLGARRFPALRGAGGSMALVTVFGNIAYLGLPVVERALGPAVLGIASLLVALHVLCAMTLGPWLLLRWSGATPSKDALGRVVRQPLLWAPLVGLALHALPPTALEGVRGVLAPLGASAGPVSLFLLGLYVHTERARLRSVDARAVAHVAARLVLVPAVTLAMVVPLHAVGLLERDAARVALLLAAMPAAITTFALARGLSAGEADVAKAVVLSSVASAATLPLVAWIAEVGIR